MSTLTSTAHVATATPDRYAKQLVAHLGRKVAFLEDPAARTWSAELAGATGTITVAEAEIVLTASATDTESLARVEHVLGSHLERFGSRQELVVAWQPAA